MWRPGKTVWLIQRHSAIDHPRYEQTQSICKLLRRKQKPTPNQLLLLLVGSLVKLFDAVRTFLHHFDPFRFQSLGFELDQNREPRQWNSTRNS